MATSIGDQRELTYNALVDPQPGTMMMGANGIWKVIGTEQDKGRNKSFVLFEKVT